MTTKKDNMDCEDNMKIVKWKPGHHHSIASMAHPLSDKRRDSVSFVQRHVETKASMHHVNLEMEKIVSKMDLLTIQILWIMLRTKKDKYVKSAYNFVNVMIKEIVLDCDENKVNTLTTEIIEELQKMVITKNGVITKI